MNVAPAPEAEASARLAAVLATVPDPEIPAVSIVELGIVRGIERNARGVETVIITPTYSGCPATLAIQMNIRAALDAAGFEAIGIETRIAPAWTTDWITDAGREKLRAYGIAPPDRGAAQASLHADSTPDCPHCGAHDTVEISRFGSTPCKALWQCRSCLEPFDRFKCH